MKQGKNPTRREKELLLNVNLNPGNWLVERKYNDEICFIHRISGKIRRISF